MGQKKQKNEKYAKKQRYSVTSTYYNELPRINYVKSPLDSNGHGY